MSQPERLLRLLHLIESYPPHYGGGAAITTRDVCEGLARRGHDVHVLCTEGTAEEPYSIRTETVGSVCVHRVNLPYLRKSDPEGWALGLRRWRRHERRIRDLLDGFVANWQPDLVDYHTTRPFGEEALFTFARHRFPIVATLHDAWLICQRVFLLQSPLSVSCPGPSALRCLECTFSNYERSHASALIKMPWRLATRGYYPIYRYKRRAEACRFLEGAIARSDYMAEMHAPFIPGPVRHIPPGIDQTDLPRQRPNRPRTPLRFGFLAGFQPSKGIHLLLDAATALRRQGLYFEIHLWGPGQEGRQSEIASRGLQDTVFLRGLYTPEQCWSVYEQIDVAVMATLVSEPLGRVPQEAALSGAPTIAPAIGGLNEIIRHEVDGLLFEFKSALDLERQMHRLIVEPALLPRLIANLRSVPDTRAQIPEVEAWYHEILEKRQRVDARSQKVQV